MILLLLTTLIIADVQEVNFGYASVYNDLVLACPKSTYKKTGLPVAAHRWLPCGTIINVKRIDTGKVAKAVIGDRGPYGACIPSKKNTRACGQGSKWINGRDFVRKKRPMKSAAWRGILDMSIPLARRLGVKNRLIPVVIYTDLANSKPLNTVPDDLGSKKIVIKSNNFSILTILWSMQYEIRATTSENNNREMAQDS